MYCVRIKGFVIFELKFKACNASQTILAHSFPKKSLNPVINDMKFVHFIVLKLIEVIGYRTDSPRSPAAILCQHEKEMAEIVETLD
jgi:hypothetical protein